MPKSKSKRKKGSSGGGRKTGAMSGIRSKTRSIAGTGKKEKKPMSFIDVALWIAAIGALIFFLIRRFG